MKDELIRELVELDEYLSDLIYDVNAQTIGSATIASRLHTVRDSVAIIAERLANTDE